MGFPFNIRVYGIFINDKKEILVADEFRFGMKFTKFPGGGLEFGEGTIECIKRECIEELGQEVEVLEHFYTTDYFQPSAFNKAHQLLSIYYFFKTIDLPKFRISNKKFDFENLKEGVESFRWVPMEKLSEDDFEFPVDKKVAGMLKKKFTGELRK